MIHVLTRHLAPELDHFRFYPGIWSMLHFDRNWDIFGDVLTHGYNWAKMRNKRKNQHAKDGTERGQKGPRSAGLALFGAQSISVFFSVKYASTLICVLPNCAPSKRESEKGSRKDREDPEKSIQRYVRVRHKRKATPEASSSLGATASWRTARDPSLVGDFVTMIDYASLSFMG